MEWVHGGDWTAYQQKYGKSPIDFSANVSPLGMPKAAREAVITSLDESGQYPDPFCRKLRMALSRTYGIPMEQIVCGAGAADLIWRLAKVFRCSRALVPMPAFLEYEKALSLEGSTVIRYTLTEDSGFSLPLSFLDAIEPDIDLVFLCNPNNPTGRLVNSALLERILQKCEDVCAALIVDECFLDFVDDSEERTLLHALNSHPNLVILKAFTKTYAMAGLRLGYAFCGNSDLADQLLQAGAPWSVSSTAQSAGIAALSDTKYPERLKKLIKQERERMDCSLRKLGFRVIPGKANYLLFFYSDSSLHEKLSRRGFLIRDCSNYPGLTPGWYRIAIRTGPENDLLIKAFKEVLDHG